MKNKLKYTVYHERSTVLQQRRNLKMASSVQAYVRGNTHKFYEWLGAADSGNIPEGPPIWICGDCHLGNLGPLADTDGQIAIQIRDLDQSVIGNPAHDLIRLGLSLAMAANRPEPKQFEPSKPFQKDRKIVARVAAALIAAISLHNITNKQEKSTT